MNIVLLVAFPELCPRQDGRLFLSPPNRRTSRSWSNVKPEQASQGRIRHIYPLANEINPWTFEHASAIFNLSSCNQPACH